MSALQHFEQRAGLVPSEAVAGTQPVPPVDQVSRVYADPFTLFHLIPGWNALTEGGGAAAEGEGGDGAVVAALRLDRDYNFSLRMTFEGTLRELEKRRRLKRGTVEGLIAGVSRQGSLGSRCAEGPYRSGLTRGGSCSRRSFASMTTTYTPSISRTAAMRGAGCTSLSNSALFRASDSRCASSTNGTARLGLSR